jgi:glycosyltransferase involved in cell wall biosynthesis
LVDKVKAKKKIGWIHTNYSSSGLDPKFDENYFSKLNYLVTVSPECKQSLMDNFPKLEPKIKVIHNIVSAKTVQELANETLEDFSFSPNENSIVTVARLSHEKGIDIALNACKEIVQTNPNVKWYVIGEGNERSQLEQFIEQNQLENNFILLGLRANPYPYMKQATIYVQPSRYEGKSIAIDEAKILTKPIVVTGFETAKDQINHLQNGIISGTNAQELAADILKVLNDENLQNNLSLHLTNEVHDNSNEEITKFYKLLNE